jgi:cation diffusion facilitator CzcD-associated flavoprotein CzcO
VSDSTQADSAGLPEHTPIAIVGAGFAGIGLAIKLREAGFYDLLIIERGADLGGTWRVNTYPGCACDVPSELYSYSFDPNPDWSRTYGTQPEILAYIRSVAERHDVVRHMRFNTELLKATWDEDTRRWTLATSAGNFTADVVVSATGLFSDASIPTIAGLDTFVGTMFHSLHWDHDHNVSGERVAVIGTGASAVQFIPEIQPIVQQLNVFQRSAPWIMPRLDRHAGTLERALLRRIPLVGKAIRAGWYTAIEGFGLVGFVDKRFRHPYELIGRLQLRRQISDAELRRKVTPDYMIGCKRAIFSSAYLPALEQDNVEVVTDRIAEVRERSIVTADGTEHEVDTIILGTGFGVPPTAFDRYLGTDGRSLADRYHERPQTYLGASVAGFPNFFMTLGPFGAAGNQSAIFMIECQIAYIVDALRQMRSDKLNRVEVRRDVQDSFVDDVEARSHSTVWVAGGCKSYYTNDKGHNAGLYPNWSFKYRYRTRKFDRESYEVRS